MKLRDTGTGYLVGILMFISSITFGQGTNVVYTNHHVKAPVSGGGGYNEPSHWGAIDSLWIIAESQYMTIDTRVSQWDDISGQDNHEVQAITDRQPDHANDSVYYNGGLYATNSLMNISQPCVIYMVVKINDYLTSAKIIELNGSNAYFGLGASQGAYSDSTQWRIYAGAFNNGSSSNLIPLDAFCLLRVELNGTSSSMKINNRAKQTGDAGTNSITEIDIADEGPVAGRIHMAVKELIVLAATESAGEETNSLTYFNDKYTLW